MSPTEMSLDSRYNLLFTPNHMGLGIILATIAAISFAFANVVMKKSFATMSPSVSFLIFSVFCFFIWPPIALLIGVEYAMLPQAILYGIIAAILAQVMYFFVLEKGEISITGAILASYSFYTVVFSIILNGEQPTPLQIAFIAATIIGTTIVSLPSKFNRSELAKLSQVAWGLFGAISIGLSDTLTKGIIDQSSSGTFLIGLGIAQIPVALVYYVATKQRFTDLKKVFRNYREQKFEFLSALFTLSGATLLFISFEMAPASIVAPISAAYPVLLLFLARIWLKEKINIKSLVGVIIVIIGVVGIAIVSG